MLSIDKKTGEISYTPVSKFKHVSVGRKRGSMIRQNYGFTYDEKLRKEVLVPTDTTDMQEYINSFADEADVYAILKKYSKTGDISLLDNKPGFYADISGIGDELDPGAVTDKALEGVQSLSKKLGIDISASDLLSMSSVELEALILKAQAAQVKKSQAVQVDNQPAKEVKEGE